MCAMPTILSKIQSKTSLLWIFSVSRLSLTSDAAAKYYRTIQLIIIGNNLAKVRKCLEENYNYKIAIQLLVSFHLSCTEIKLIHYRLRCLMPLRKFMIVVLFIEMSKLYRFYELINFSLILYFREITSTFSLWILDLPKSTWTTPRILWPNVKRLISAVPYPSLL